MGGALEKEGSRERFQEVTDKLRLKEEGVPATGRTREKRIVDRSR